MINFIDTFDEERLNYFEQEFEMLSTSNNTFQEIEQQALNSEQDSNQMTPQQPSMKKIKLPIQRRRPPKRIQYTYHKKKKRPAPKPIIHMKENGLKVCLVLEKPKSNAHPFSNTEDRRIMELVLSIGPKFYKISKSFPGKSVSMVKNRYYKYLRYRWDVVMGCQYKHLNVPFEDPLPGNMQNGLDLEDQNNLSC